MIIIFNQLSYCSIEVTNIYNKTNYKILTMAIDDIVETILLTASKEELLRSIDLIDEKIKEIDSREDSSEEQEFIETVNEELDEELDE